MVQQDVGLLHHRVLVPWTTEPADAVEKPSWLADSGASLLPVGGLAVLAPGLLGKGLIDRKRHARRQVFSA
ncbi:MAG: hypothetical protein A2V70_18265 [Planctomycetes bacterium RBG_13_63_9]|nr:MAG: hypothetical protein A2V70_18265 [Planctomycetes bacterium RBG_13_63_9]